MSSPYPQGNREKVASKLPSALQQELKIRCAELGLDIQNAVTAGIESWRAGTNARTDIDTSGARSFSTWLPTGMYERFKESCNDRSVSYTQGLAQSVRLWLDDNPSPRQGGQSADVRRLVLVNQKGGVGKTAVSLGVAESYAEDEETGTAALRRYVESLSYNECKRLGRTKSDLLDKIGSWTLGGKRVLLVDYDPQGHLSDQLGIPQLPPKHDSLISHMVGEGTEELRRHVVPVEDPHFHSRLDVLPAAFDGFLLDSRIALAAANSRGFQKEAALEHALYPLEEHYDIIVIDCPPSLGLATDAALYYGRRRRNERQGKSGVVIPVLAEDSSATAYMMLAQQIEDLCKDLSLEIDYLGLVINMYDSRRGFVATSSLDSWHSLADQRVLSVIDDLKEQREAVRLKQALLSYAPDSKQANSMRLVALGVAG
ncbi:ParA family protein [Streptomyces fractus]|uniref:ParA family protein n=1 Tax=Streptomyces fractus TaxID=641806 RepID=UPI003CED0F7F